MSHQPTQLDLLGDAAPQRLPPGVTYRRDVLTPAEERELAAQLGELPLAPFVFRGFVGNRRTASFGWRYDFNVGGLQKAAPIPDCFLPWRDKVASVAGIPPDSLEQMLVSAYAPGAGIGWHRDRPQFGIVAAISLLAPCRMRFRRKRPGGWDRLHANLEPRSGYVLAQDGRHVWEHSIPPVDALRYSLTFRTLIREDRA